MGPARTSSAATALATALPILAGCAGTYDRGYEGAAYYAEPGTVVTVSTFYESLAPWGVWIDYAPYGWCWSPRAVPISWRPYYDGAWIYTDFGWTWISEEPWGWATYHYGRWLLDPAYGWLWVPGTVWAPSWVAWRSGGDWVGWAPLPPSAQWGASGLRFVDDLRIPPDTWCFVEQRSLSGRKVRDHVVSVTRNVTLLAETRDRTRFDVRHGTPANFGVDVRELEKRTGRDVRRLEVAVAASPRGSDRVGGDQVRFFRPSVEAGDPRVTPPAPPPGSPAASPPKPRTDRLALESHLDEEQARMAARHRDELASRARGADAAAVRRQQAEERRAFEEYAERERRLLERRREAVGPAPGRPKTPRQDPKRAKDPSSGNPDKR